LRVPPIRTRASSPRRDYPRFLLRFMGRSREPRRREGALADGAARAPGPHKEEGRRRLLHRYNDTHVSGYDNIARLYDPWSRSVVEDVSFYVEEAVRCGGPVLELGVGTGRVAIPVAAAGIRVVGVDLSGGMLELERERGIWERADWDEETRTLILRVRGHDAESEMSLAWLSVSEWRVLLREEGFVVDAVFGWFDRSPWRGGEDSIWVCRLAGV